MPVSRASYVSPGVPIKKSPDKTQSHLPLKISKEAPLPCSHNSAPMERDAEFPESMVYPVIYISEDPPIKELSYETEDNYMVTTHRAPHRRKDIVRWGAARFPKGIVCDTGITTPVPCSLQHDNFHFGLCRPLVLHTCYYLTRDTGYGTPHNPEVQTRVWIHGRFVEQLPYLVL